MIQMLHHLLLIQVLEGEPQVEEGVLDDMPAVPAPSRRESVFQQKLKKYQQQGT